MRNEDKIVPKPPVSQTPSLNKHSATIPGTSAHVSFCVVVALSDLLFHLCRPFNSNFTKNLRMSWGTPKLQWWY